MAIVQELDSRCLNQLERPLGQQEGTYVSWGLDIIPNLG